MYKPALRSRAPSIFACLISAYILVVLKTVACASQQPSITPSTFYGASYALLIGINRYSKLPANVQLQYAVQDVDALKEVLVKRYGFPRKNIKTLVDAAATRDNIHSALSALSDIAAIKPQDRILIYFSGHGQTIKLPTGADMGFLIPSDAAIDFSDTENAAPYLTSCIRMDTIWGYLESSPAKHTLLLADACYSGLLTKSRGSIKSRSPSELAGMRAMQVITGGDRGQKTVEDSSWGHGAFTFKLIEELKARATTGGQVFTASELHSSLAKSVSALTHDRQTPLIGSYKSDDGDFLFITTAGPSVPADKARLLIASRPPGAKVFIDGHPLVERTPTEVDVDAGASSVEIAIERPGYRTAIRKVKPNGGHEMDLAVFNSERLPTSEMIRLANELLTKDGAQDARVIYDDLFMSEPSNRTFRDGLVKSLLTLASSRLEVNDQPGSEAYFEQVRSLDRKDGTLLVSIADTLARNPRFKETAQKYYKEAEALGPDNVGLLVNLGASYHAIIHNDEEAERVYARAVKLGPENASVLVAYASFLVTTRHENREALAMLKRAQEIAPNNLAEYLWLFRITRGDYGMEPDLEAMTNWALKGLEYFPTNMELLRLLSWAYERLGRWDEAIKWAKIAAERNPTLGEPWKLAGRYAGLAKRFTEGEQYFQQAVRIAPNDADVRFEFGGFQLMQSGWEKAEPYFLKALEIDPKHYWANVEEARILMDRHHNLLEAERLLRKAIANNEKATDQRMELVRCLMLQGKVAAANEEKQQAIKAVRGIDEPAARRALNLPWCIHVGGGAVSTLIAENASLTIAIPSIEGKDSRVHVFQPHMDLQENQVYTLEFRAHADRQVDLTVFANAGQDTKWRSVGLNTTVKLSAEWKRYRLNFTAKNTVPNDEQFDFQVIGQKGTVWIEDFSLRPGKIGP